MSIRIDPASANSLGVTDTLTLGTAPGSTTDANGELAPLFSTNAPATHGCRFSLASDVLFSPIGGDFYLDIPPLTDVNTNALNDFFEVSQAASGGSTGVFIDDLTHEQGKINAAWDRAAGSASGICQLHLQSSYIDLTFAHPFTILEYDGALDYASMSARTTGSVNLADASVPTNVLTGPLVLNKIDNDDLTLQAGGWTNATGQTWSYLATAVGETIARKGTNYLDFLDSNDGDLSTSSPDFLTWIILLSDANDSNQNAIPDLSDLAPPHAPSVILQTSGGQLSLSLAGDVGWSYRVEQIPVLGQTNWTKAASLALTNSPQIIQLSLPQTQTSFWRVASPAQ